MAGLIVHFFWRPTETVQIEANCANRKILVLSHSFSQPLLSTCNWLRVVSVWVLLLLTHCHQQWQKEKGHCFLYTTNNQYFRGKSRRPHLYVASICCSEVRHSASVNWNHIDRSDQGVNQVFVPELQPLNRVGQLKAVHALLPFMDPFVWVAVVWGTLQRNHKKKKYRYIFSVEVRNMKVIEAKQCYSL